jgi:hypothetical protein
MASKTKTTEFRRHIRNRNAGRKRKNQLENYGSTPAFPLHTAEADANAPQEAKPQ